MGIRNYRKSDYSQLEKLLKITKLYNKISDNKRAIAKKIESDPGSIIIDEDKGKIIGCVFFSYQLVESIIYHIGVLPSYQKKGIGTKLIKHTQEILKKRGSKRLLSFVFTTNKKSSMFFSKTKWKKIGKLYCFEKQL